MSAKPYLPAVAFAKQLTDRYSDQILWGMDFPHPNLKAEVRERDLVNLIPLYAPEPDTQRKMLVTNPARLYGFDLS
jgi:predicted TIM-barrel fold metal-dependent hydrolase